MRFVLSALLAGTALLVGWLGHLSLQPGSAQPAPGRQLPEDQLTAAALQYLLIDRFGEPFYCDPDAYPVGRTVTIARVRERVLALSATDPATFQAIAAHLAVAANPALLDDEQARQVYAESKRLAAVVLEPVNGGYRFRIRVVGGSDQGGRAISGVVDPSGGVSDVTAVPDAQNCPRCLPGETIIDTPAGSVAVQDLRRGMSIWTAGPDGARRAAVVLDTVALPVPPRHELVHVLLDDGRQLSVSPGHPAVDGKPVGSLAKGDLLDGAHVVKAERTLYQGPATYDILPSGETGAYWADSILLGSTLIETAGPR
jgi:hypothetical protein